MTLKRILLIAPDHTGLDWPVELEQVGSRHQVVALLGRVDQERITRATTGQRFDVIHVASHGSAEGIQLSEGWMGMVEFGQMARHVRADLVFLNACESARLAQYLIDLGLRTVMAWTVAVVDGNAIRTASYFYDELALQDDLRLAYNKVNPRDGSLTFLAGQGYLEDVIRPVLDQLVQVGQQVMNLVGTVTTQGKALRFVVAAVTAAIVLALVLVVVGIVRAAPQEQTVPAATSLPGCNAAGGQPKKCTPVGITDTPVPDTTGPTTTLVATVPPRATPTAGPTETPTAREIETATPVESPTEAATVAPTAMESPGPTGRPTATRKPHREPTDEPTQAPTRTGQAWTPTVGDSEAVDNGTVEATATVVPPTATKWPTVTPTLMPCR